MALFINGEQVVIAGPELPAASTLAVDRGTFEVRSFVGGVQAEYRLTDLSQTQPAGRYRLRTANDGLTLDRAASATGNPWDTYTTLFSVGSSGAFTFTVTDAVDNTVLTALTLNRNTTNALPAIGLGVRLSLGIESSTTVDTQAATIDAVWTTITHATRTADLILSVLVSGTLTERMRVLGASSTLQFAAATTITTSVTTLTLTPTTDVHITNGHGLVIGHTAQIAVGGLIVETEIIGANTTAPFLSIARWVVGTGGAHLFLAHSRNATIGSFTKLNSGDELGGVSFYGDDGTDLATPGARITAEVDGTTGADDMPGRLIFSTTADGAAAVTERLRINNGGILILAGGEGGVTAATGNVFRAPNITTGGAGNLAGADLTFAAGLGTGTGDEGTLIFSLPIVAAAGDNIQTTATRLTFDMAGSTTTLTMQFAQAAIIGTDATTLTLTPATDVHISDTHGLVIGHTAQLTIAAIVPEFQVLGTAPADSSMTIMQSSVDAVGPTLIFGKGRDALGVYTTMVVAGDSLGAIRWYGANGTNMGTESAQIRAEAGTGYNGTIDAPGRLLFLTTPDGGAAVVERLRITTGGVLTTLVADPANVTATGAAIASGGIAFTDVLDAWIDDATHGTGTTPIYIGTAIIVVNGAISATLGYAGPDSTGRLLLLGKTSGTVTLSVADAAGTWTMKLPTGVAGTAGFQLTDAAASGVTSWAAAASRREWKNDLGIMRPQDALDQILNTVAVHRFTYRAGCPSTGDYKTEYVGVFADEAPWAMHFNGGIVNPVNTLGYMVLGFQAMDSRLRDHETRFSTVEERLAAMEEANRILRGQLVAAGVVPEV